MHITSLALGLSLLASAIPNVMAVKVTFRRFTHEGCNDNFNIAKDTHLDDNHCKTFDHDEPPFMSFSAIPEKDQDDITKKLCYIVAYADRKCTGKAYTMHDMKDAWNQCGNVADGGLDLGARSVKVICDKRPESVSTVLPTKSTSTPVVAQTQTVLPTKSTSTVVVEEVKPTTKSTTTVTLVPRKTCGACDM